MHASRVVLIFTAGVGMICTFLPWVSLPFVGDVYGTRGDGWITLAVCAAAAVCSLVEDRHTPLTLWAILVSALCGFTAALIAVWDIVRVNDAMAPLATSVSIGPGLYLLVVAGGATAILPALLSRSPNVERRDRVATQRF